MIEIRSVAPRDWRLWRDVRLRALEDAPHAFGSTLAGWLDADEARWRDRLTTVPFNVVAYAGNDSVGQVSGTARDDSGDVELMSMWVAPEARGRGAGDALVAAVVAWARDRGAAAVTLSVKRGNDHAIALYERNGFVRSGRGDEPGEVGMRRPLG